MITILCSSLRSGSKIIFENFPYEVESNNFVNPGKGQAFVRIKLRNLSTGRLINKTFKSTDSLKVANIKNIIVSYLYNDGKFWYFMDHENFCHISMEKKKLLNREIWLFNQSDCIITLWEENPISLSINNFVDLLVKDTSPYIKGDTVNSLQKSAKLITGAVVKVPSFIQIGDVIRVDTRTGIYVSRI